jgi:SHS2 domain-containing protein
LGDVELLPHTGDVGIRVRAASLEDLLATAAAGMFGILAGPPDRTDLADSIDVEVEEERAELLLRAWLDELLFRFSAERRLYGLWEIRAASPRRVEAVARGTLFDPDRHELRTELKAVTYHGLRAEGGPGGWTATVIFDV